MQNPKLHAQVSKINNLFDKTKTIDDLELQGQWGRYLCILVAGFVENSLCELFQVYSDRRTDPIVLNFVRKKINEYQNPKASRFVEVARIFDESWAGEIENFFANNPSSKDAIDSIMTNRHKIAHGGDSGVSIVTVKKYYSDLLRFLHFLEMDVLKLAPYN
ncbi:HEPN domain-containing protein [Chromobacterium violaceum]|uniref:HEPN domain-containing protein n=1 Tax=Chromobacterium violaceum TaxID=536 RepID=UPI003DA9B3BD